MRNNAGVMRAGILPAHFNPLVTGRSDMKLNIGDFRAVQNRGGAVWLANVGTDSNVTLPAAPAANRRIDLIYVTMRSADLGDPASTPVFGFVQGVASATPVVPSLPANLSTAIPLATVEIPAGATTTLSAGVIITQAFPYTAMAGGTVPVRNLVELGAWTPADGARAFCLADNSEYVRSGGVWVRGAVAAASLISASLTASTWVPLTSVGSWSFSPALQMPWNSGVVIPASGSYLLAVAAEIVGGGATHGRFALKKNDTSPTNAGTILASQSRQDAGSIIVSASRQVPLSAGDVITPAAIAFGGSATLTASMTGFSIQRVG